jgi:hypothetical protein
VCVCDLASLAGLEYRQLDWIGLDVELSD